MPSRLDELKWAYTLEDLRFKTKMRFQEEQVRAVQDYENLILVVSQALGGKPSKSNNAPSSDVPEAKTKEEVKMYLNAVLFPPQMKS